MNIKIDKDVDTLNFKIINPKGKEDWADDCDISQAVEIYINGKEIVEILKEIETPFAKNEMVVALLVVGLFWSVWKWMKIMLIGKSSGIIIGSGNTIFLINLIEESMKML